MPSTVPDQIRSGHRQDAALVPGIGLAHAFAFCSPLRCGPLNPQGSVGQTSPPLGARFPQGCFGIPATLHRAAAQRTTHRHAEAVREARPIPTLNVSAPAEALWADPCDVSVRSGLPRSS